MPHDQNGRLATQRHNERNILNVELRDSGRDLVQINDDGTHAILLVAMHFKCTPDHVRLPVMWLRRSDGKLRRDGSSAASQQPNSPVDERGRLHGASGLAVVEQRRVLARIRGPCRNQERKREWLKWRRRLDRLRRQDKARKVHAVGRVKDGSDFNRVTNIAKHRLHLAMFGNVLSPLNFRHPLRPK